MLTFTREQDLLRQSIRDLCAKRCDSRESRQALLDPGEEEHSSVLYNELAALGYVGIGIPEEYQGSGGDYVDQVILFEELWAGLAPVKALGSTMTVAGCYRRFGSEVQKLDALPAIAAGKTMSISISEPGAGSDVAAISTRAQKVDGGWLLNGQKTWCSFAHMADRILLLARTSVEEKRHRGITIFEMRADHPGLTSSRISTMGGSEVNDLFLTDCFVPDDAVVGHEGEGFRQIMAGLDGERLLGAALGLGIARRALEDTLAFVKTREQFGRPIGCFQSLRHRLADIFIELECARLLTYEAAERMSAGDERVSSLTSMAKIKTSEVAKHATLEGMQMMGGYGYSTEYGMADLVRSALLLPIYAGVNEVQRDIVSRSLGLVP
jgi:alkylation response protein AidB-like acyl-CoA dehydrogenase